MNREEQIDKLLTFISDWETDGIAGMVEALLNELSDERLAAFIEEQGIV